MKFRVHSSSHITLSIVSLCIFAGGMLACSDDDTPDIDCEATPENPACENDGVVNCEHTPEHPSCEEGTVDCEETPDDPECQSTSPEELSHQTFVASFGAGDGRVCYALASDEIVACDEDSSDWDLMVEIDGRAFNIWTNGGVYGTGEGAALGPFPEEELAQFSSFADVPGWFADVIGGIFVDAPWQSYDVMGTHDVTANGRVYVIETPEDAYRFQIPSYYTNGVSGMLQVRFASLEEDPEDAIYLEIDATAGGFGAGADDPANKFTYLDLDTGEILDLSDAEAAQNTAWDVGFKRFDVIVNGGASGPSTAKGALAVANDDLYDDEGNPIRSKFEDMDDAEMLAAFESEINTDSLRFVSDRGTPFFIGDGVSSASWFTVIPPPQGPDFTANDENWWFVRSADKSTFAQLHVADIDYSPTERVFTLEMFVGTK